MLLVSIKQLILLLLIQRLNIITKTLPHSVPVLLGALLLDLAFVGEEHLSDAFYQGME